MIDNDLLNDYFEEMQEGLKLMKSPLVNELLKNTKSQNREYFDHCIEMAHTSMALAESVLYIITMSCLLEGQKEGELGKK